jgi:branched-subunit amino acid transport protein AzlD
VPDTTYVIAAIALAAAITFALRALPFAVVEPLRSSRVAAELGARMPAGLMLILVIYLLRDVPTKAPAAVATTMGAALVVAVLQLWRSSALLSIFAGTAVYVVVTNLLVH